MLDAAEGKAWIAGDDGVEEDGAALELDGETPLFVGVGGPGAGGEAEGCVVGESDGLVDRADAEEQSDGAEDLFLADGCGAENAGDDCGLEVVAAGQAFEVGGAIAAGEDAAACGFGAADLGEKIVDDLRSG